MEGKSFIYFIGTAGAGKSTLTGAFKEWCGNEDIDAIIVNLDPGADALPYEADVDVRDWIKLDAVMKEYELGPNGAQIAAADMLAVNADEIKDVIDTFKSDYVLVDTPGQIELFVFRESGKYVVDLLGRERSLMTFLIDPFLAKTASEFVSQMLLSANVQFRFYLPLVNVLTKVDMLEADSLMDIIEWSENRDALENAVMAEAPSMYKEINYRIGRLLDELSVYSSLIQTSCKNLEGMEDVYNAVQNCFSGGEDLGKD